jgi:hypothetical protein
MLSAAPPTPLSVSRLCQPACASLQPCTPQVVKVKKKKVAKKDRVAIHLGYCRYDAGGSPAQTRIQTPLFASLTPFPVLRAVRQCAKANGWRAVYGDDEWDIFWTDTNIPIRLGKYQKVNHFAGKLVTPLPLVLSNVARLSTCLHLPNELTATMPICPFCRRRPAAAATALSYASARRNHRRRHV